MIHKCRISDPPLASWERRNRGPDVRSINVIGDSHAKHYVYCGDLTGNGQERTNTVGTQDEKAEELQIISIILLIAVRN